MLQRFKDKKVLITGGSGFIGTHLCKLLFQEGAKVNITSRKNRRYDSNINVWKVDLRYPQKIKDIIELLKPDYIFHLASTVNGSRDVKFVLPTLNNNLVSTVNLLTAAQKIGCEKIVLAGSMEEHSLIGYKAPNSPYSAAKMASTLYGKMFYFLYNLPVVMLRIFMVYGPGQYDLTKLIPYTITILLNGKSPYLSSGKRLVDWIHVHDVVRGMAAAALSSNSVGKELDIGSGMCVSIKEITKKIAQLIDNGIYPEYSLARNRKNEITVPADVVKTKSIIQWEKAVSLEDGLLSTVEWYKNEFPPKKGKHF